MNKIILFTLVIFISATGNAWAIQRHEGLSGFYAHQIGHIFFIAAMGYIYRVLKKPAASRLKGWRFIRYAAVLFLLWNIDTFLGHVLDTLYPPVITSITESRVLFGSPWVHVYYFTRISEYLFLVPAFIMMAVGVYKIKKQLEKESAA